MALHGEVEQDPADRQRHDVVGEHTRDGHRDDREHEGRTAREVAEAAVAEPAGDRGGARSGGSDEREQADRRLAEPELRDEVERDRRPERREHAEHQRLAARATPQRLVTPHQGEHRPHQLGIRRGRVRVSLRQHAEQQQRQHHHHHRRDEIDRLPAPGRRDEARQGARQQDPEQKPHHHLADDAPALPLGGEIGGDGHDHLHDHRRHADEHRHREEQRERRCERRDGEGHRRAEQGPGREPAVLQLVAERHHQDHAERVAELRQRHHEGGRALGDREVSGDEPQQRLRVVDVGHGEPAGQGHDDRDQSQISHRLHSPPAECRAPAGKEVPAHPPSAMSFSRQSLSGVRARMVSCSSTTPSAEAR